MKRKYKIVDTNLLLSDPDAYKYFGPKKPDEQTHVIIPLEVLAELDKFKSEMNSDRGANARTALKNISALRKENGGSLFEGIKMRENYFLQSSYSFVKQGIKDLPGLDSRNNDSKILKLVHALKRKGEDVELITNDSGLLDIASAFGIEANPWRDLESTVNKLEECYKGWRKVQHPDLFEMNQKQHYIELKQAEKLGIENVLPNEYIILTEKPEAIVLRYDAKQKKFVQLDNANLKKYTKVTPKNVFQQIYLDILRNTDIDLVFAVGVAGTSKTFLSVDAALCQAIQFPPSAVNVDAPLPYSRAFITRPRVIASSEQDMGFLPGDIQEKVDPWFGPIYDQLYQLFELYGYTDDVIEHIMGEENSLMNGKKTNKSASASSMMQKKKIHIFDTLYKRGRSLVDAIWVIDDAQNLTRSQMYDLGTRAGEKCKVIVNGDPTQCDIKGESALLNSVIWANEAFKKDETSATVWFPDEYCVRSRLASKFIEYLGHKRR